MANESVLRAYLVSIGFKVDDDSYKKFKDRMGEADKRTQNFKRNFEEFGKFALGWASTFTATALVVASKMEQIGFAARRAGTSAKNLQAFEFGARAIGMSAEEARSALEGMAMAVRLNPGLMGLMTGMGINPREDRVQMMLDLVDRLKTMPFALGARVGEMFGIDPQNLLMLEQGTEELKKNIKARQDMAKQTGTDADKMAAESHSFMQNVRGLEERFEIFTDLAATKLLPEMEKIAGSLGSIVDLLLQADKATSGWSSAIGGILLTLGGFVGSLGVLKGLLGMLGVGGGTAAGGAAAGGLGALGGTIAGIPLLGAAGYYLKKAWDFFNLEGEDREKMHLHRLELLKQQRPLLPEEQATYDQLKRGEHPIQDVPPPIGNIIDKYARIFGVDPALLHAQAFQESRGNQRAFSKKGAIGVMQLMPGTALSLGVDPFNTEENIMGGVKQMATLLKKYKGNIPLALAAYDAGAGAVDKFGGIPPFKETQDYVARITARLGMAGARGGVSLNQKTDIHVNGAGDPQAVGRAVAGQQARVNGDALRNLAAYAK